MSDIVSAFKQNTRRKRANYQDEQQPKELDALSALQQKRQQNTVQQESNTNTALESSQRQNVQLGNNTSESQKLAQLQQLAAQEQAQNAANAAAAQQKQQEQQQQRTQQVQPKDNDGWKKYYDKEKQIVREQAFKSDSFGSWLQDVFNSGWDSRLAEQRARDKYANEMINQSFNDDGSVKDANKLNETKQFTAHNMNVAKQYGDYERARGNAIGANLTSDKHNNPFKATANAVRNMDIGNAILGSNDPEGTEGSKYNTARDVGKFLTNLVPGMLSAPITGLTNVSEAISGKGTDEQTGLEKELDNLSRVGKGIAGGIDVAGVFFGGSKEALTRVSDALFRKGTEKVVKETSKGVIKNVLDSMIKEGAEEATQQAAEFFGNGGKLVTKDGQFDNDSFKELLAESGKAGALGAVGGGLMNVGGRGVARLINNSQTKTNTQQGINSNINNNLIAREQAQENLRQKEQQAVEQPVTEDVRETENVNEDVSKDTQEDIAERTQVQEEVKETSNTQYEQDIRNSLNDAYRNLSKTITPENKANLDGEIKQLADTRNTMPIDKYAQKAQEILDKYSQTTAEQAVEPKTESVTGQPVNPQDISKVTAPTVGTQASETPANVKTDVTENNAVYNNEDTDGLTKAYNRYAKRYEDALNSGDKEAISKARDNYNLALETVAGEDTAQYDVDKGVVVNQVLAEEMFNNGVDGPDANSLHANMFEITDGKPLAHDYTTGEDLYFLDDINNALKRDGYKDAIGNQFKTFAQITKERDTANQQAFQQALEESIAKSDNAKPTADKINDIGYDRNISFDDFEQSRYDYYRSKDPDFKEYDDATINQWIERDWEILQSENDSQTNVQTNTREKSEPTAETELNDLINTARNEAPEPIPMEAYGVEPEMEQTPAQQPTTQNETVTTEPAEQINPFRQKIEQYYNTRKAELEDLYRATGLTPEIQSKVQNATDMSRTVDDPVDLGLTPEETNAYRKALELNPAVENVELAMARGYLPRQKVGTTNSTRLADEYINTGKINKLWENSRLDESEGGVSAEEADTSYDPLIDWHIRAENPELNNLEQQAAAYDLVDDIAPNAYQDTKVEASQDISNMIDELNDVASGEEIKDSDIKKVKPLDILEKVGTKTQQQKVLIPKMRGLSDDVKLKNETNPQYDQWYHNASFGYMQNLNAFANDTKENVDSLINNSFEHLTDKQRQGILAKREKIYNGILKKVQDEKLATFMTNRVLIKEAFNKNIMNYGTKVEFESPKDKAMMNEYFARYMLQDRYEQSFLQKTGVVVQRIMNSSFRGMRVQTTLNEIPEILSSMSDFRTLKVAKLGTWQQTKARYGIEGNGYTEQFINSLPKDMRADIEQAIDGTEDVRQQVKLLKQIGKKFGNALDKADKATQWNAFIQDWKDATYLQNAENFYREQGFEGPALTEKVLSSFEARMLPMSRVFKIIKTDSGISKPFLMYMDSTARLTRKFVKGAVGENKVGVNADLNRGQRIARNIGTDVLPRSITAMIMGVPITSVIGAFQMGGDYSGISDEDKNVLDEAINFIAQLSPVVSVLAYGYNQERQDEIAEGQGNNQPDLRGDAGTRFVNNLKKTFTPLGARLDQDFGYAGNLNNTKDVYGRGYGENKSGRVQYLSPDNPVDWVLGAISGTNKTSEAREYANNPDLISAIINQIRNKDYDGDEQADGGLSDFLKYNQAFTNPITGEKIFASKDDYNRPASMSEQSNYNQKIQDALKAEDRELAQEWYEKSRQYNSVLDNLRVNNKDAYDVYQSQYDKNIVTPEKWARIAYGNATADRNPQSIDLTVWNTMKQLALQKNDDFGTPIDPAYTQLDDEQTRRYLAYKATATGEDVLLKKDMCLDPFWDSFFDKQNDYYNQIGNSEFDDSKYSARVQEWNDWNDQYGDYQKFISGNIDTMKDQQLAFELSLQFPLMTEYQKLKTALKAKYGDEYKDSQEYKSFWSQNYDAYNEESDAFNQRILYIINQMRRIEGFDDMTIDQLETINGFGKDSSKKSSGKSSGKSYGGSDYSYAPKFENIFQADPLYTKEYGGFKPIKPNLAGNPNFENVGFSSTAGKDPYAQV